MIINQTQSLEDAYQDLHIREVNVEEKCDFKDCLSPNENPSMGLGEHLKLSQPGIIVSTGTERSFFNLLLCPETCEGIVIRDINPRVKAYVDFNAMLIRISDTCDEYSKWSSQTLSESTQICQIIEEVRVRILNTPLPLQIKDYYLKNASAFGEIYLRADKSWKSDENFKECLYHQNDIKFSKIKSYIEAGNMISTIGEINDLEFLKNRTVAVVDTSNICEYSLLDLQGGKDFHPRVIWTYVFPSSSTQYCSYIHSSLDSKNREIFEKLIQKMRNVWERKVELFPSEFPEWISYELKKFNIENAYNRDVGAIYSINSLQALEKYFNNLHDRDSARPYLKQKDLERINFLFADALDQLCNSEGIIHYIPQLVLFASSFKPHVNVAFSKIEHWKWEFEMRYQSPLYLDSFLKKLETASVLTEFTQNFGEERITNLISKNKNAWSQFNYDY